MSRQPLVTIGMPLYNAQRHLREALESILAQSYANFELVISDNGSSDGTELICQAVAARDERVSYHRSARNLGAVWNFNRVFELAQGDYFMWAAHDDLRAPQYLSSCVAAMEAHPEAVLCCTEIAFIDEDGKPVEPWTDLNGIRPVGATVRVRLSSIARARYWWDYYGLIRTRVLAQTRRAQPVWGFDVVVLMELCLRGPVLLVPEKLFCYRVNTEKTQQHMAVTLGTSDGPGPIPVNWSSMALELARSVWLAPLGLPSRLALIVQLMAQFCAFNGPVGSSIKKDVLPNVSAAWADRRIGRLAALLVIAGMVFALQNRVGRGGYRLMRRLRHALPLRA